MEVHNIFIVEDDAFFAQSFQKQLSKLGVFDIFIIPSVEMALSKLKTIKPEIIFLDHQLGGVNGVDAIPLINQRSPKSEIVVVSAQTDPKVLGEALDSGAKKYLSKDVLLTKKVEDFVEEMMSRESSFQSFWSQFMNMYKSAPTK